ncbi:hypothetical protein Lal_00035428 [Lupinus albus]|nr:hypothetical protein Lal_00035428 [Lupinus albus]
MTSDAVQSGCVAADTEGSRMRRRQEVFDRRVSPVNTVEKIVEPKCTRPKVASSWTTDCIQPKPPPSDPPSSSPPSFSLPSHPNFTTVTHSSSSHNPYPNLKPQKLNLRPFDGQSNVFNFTKLPLINVWISCPSPCTGRPLVDINGCFRTINSLPEKLSPGIYNSILGLLPINHKDEMFKLKQLTTITDY